MTGSSDLIRRFHAGEPGAFSNVIEDNKDDVYALCLRCVGPTKAESVAEQVFLAAHQAMHRLDIATEIRPWLLRMAVDLVLEHMPDDDDDLPERSALIQRILNELEPNFRIAVVLRDILRLTEDDVAEVLELPLGTARSRIHRGRLTLARNMSPHLDTL